MRLRIEKAIYGGSGLSRIAEELAAKPLSPRSPSPANSSKRISPRTNAASSMPKPTPFLSHLAAHDAVSAPTSASAEDAAIKHAVYAHQLEMKAVILHLLPDRAGLPHVPAIHTLSGNPCTIATAFVFMFSESICSLCYRRRGRNQLLAVDQCPIAASLLEKAIVTVTETGSLGSRWTLRFVEATADESSLLVSFVSLRSPMGKRSRN